MYVDVCVFGRFVCNYAAAKDKLSGHCELGTQQKATLTNTKMVATILTTA